MRHDYLNNTPLEEAKQRYFAHLKEVGLSSRTEIVSSTDAVGRTLKNAVFAKICSPHYNASAMDGVAVLASDTYPASEREPLTLCPDRYAVVDTGDPIPEGKNAVIMVEDLIDAGDGRYRIISPVHPWQNVRQVGEDICMGDMIAPSGTVLTPSLCGALLAGGVTEVETVAPPVVCVIPTGDEIVPPTDAPKKGEIVEFNSTVFQGMLKEFGAIPKIWPIIPDDREKIAEAIKDALKSCDIVLISAGSSAGRDDYTAQIVASLGTVCVHGISIKPGKPAILGEVSGKPAIGLPGYPVSAIVIMDEIVRDVVGMYYGRHQTERPAVRAKLAKKIVSSLKYTEYVRVALGELRGELLASPLPRGAGVITSFTKADGILTVPQDCEGLEAGAEIEVRPLGDPAVFKKTLIVTGSHDPLIDEVADVLIRRGADLRVSSTHVGSMGAIFAVKQGLAHMGAIHLLDEESGEYNRSYVDEWFPDGGAVVVKGVGRVQGLMIRKEEEGRIRSFEDIRHLRYVNRQKGAGTRILCDHLLRGFDIDPASVEGYDNEEYTHTAVAAQIACGNADAGLGIFSAAKMYGLGFLPICTESYDFLVSEDSIRDPMVRAFFDALRSDEMKRRLAAAGGYITEDGSC